MEGDDGGGGTQSPVTSCITDTPIRVILELALLLGRLAIPPEALKWDGWNFLERTPGSVLLLTMFPFLPLVFEITLEDEGDEGIGDFVPLSGDLGEPRVTFFFCNTLAVAGRREELAWRCGGTELPPLETERFRWGTVATLEVSAPGSRRRGSGLEVLRAVLPFVDPFILPPIGAFPSPAAPCGTLSLLRRSHKADPCGLPPP